MMDRFRKPYFKSVRFFVGVISVCSVLSTLYVFRGPVSYPEDDLMTELLQSVTNTTLRTIYAVTPTYKRTTQIPDMTRLVHTLSLVPNVHWIVVEDDVRVTPAIAALLKRHRVPFTHLLGPTPGNRKLRQFGRGVAPRLKALDWIRKNAHDGVLYFADDDNSYDLRVFEEIRSTKQVTVFPVGCINGIGLSSPIVRNHKVVGFHDPFHSGRLFAVDMAGFSVDIDFFKKRKNATMQYKIGYLEDTFLRSLNISLSDLEPRANECTEVLVWHTKTVNAPKPVLKNMEKEKNFNDTNLPKLYKQFLV